MKRFKDWVGELITIPAVFIDGTLYVSIALLMYLTTQFGSDEAAKYVEARTLWYITTSLGAIGTAAGALKMFRSTSYSDHLNQKKANGDTPKKDNP